MSSRCAVITRLKPLSHNYSVQLTMLVGAGVAGFGWLVTYVLAPETNGMLLTESSAVTPPAVRTSTDSPVVGDGRAEAAL
jgi:hypothetical protein